MASTLGSVCLEALRAPPGTTLSIAPISAESLQARAPKSLTRDALLDFKTLMPVPGGLYDYKVFGPGTVIDAPAPPLDEPLKPPRTQFARLALAGPIVHPLAVEHAGAQLAELAGWTEDELARWRAGGPGEVARSRGAGALVAALERSPEGRALIIRDIPVLPPDLRPLARLADDRWQTSPINELYRNVMRRNDALARKHSGDGRDAEQAALHRALLALYENEDHEAQARTEVFAEMLMSLRAAAGGTGELFAALAELAAGAPLTGRRYRASAVLFALGFELSP